MMNIETRFSRNSVSETGANPTEENFADLLEESFPTEKKFEDSVVKGRVVMIDGGVVVIDVGLKSEGRIPLREFTSAGQECELQPGDEIEVFVERMENKSGEAVLSREKARRAEAWTAIEQKFLAGENVRGVIFGRVKGGFTVDLSGALAFLPGSQVDVRPVRDVAPLMGEPQPFRILKMDRRRGNIVVSRRAVLEESRVSDRNQLMSRLEEGQILEGMVKNITDYGAFVDLGGADGLLHVTDIAWRRINHPSEVLTIGETVKVQVTRFNRETQRISLGMKQLLPDPWEGAETKYPKKSRLKGRVTNLTDYGAFVELGPGVEGLVHVSEMSWTQKNVHPSKLVSTSQEIEVEILDVDSEKRRISLGLKQCLENPWLNFADSYPPGSEYEGEIKNITEFGIFVGLSGDIDGMIHHSDLDWGRSGPQAIRDYNKGDRIKVKILTVDPEKERVSLGVKQLTGDPFESFVASVKEGDDVTCSVAAVEKNFLEVALDGDIRGIIRKTELSKERAEQRTDRFAVGERLDAKIQKIDRQERQINLSIKARENEEEQEVMARYGSSDSGALLGDILGAALDEAKAKNAKGSQADDSQTQESEAKESKPKRTTKSSAKTASKTTSKTSVAKDTTDSETEDSETSDSLESGSDSPEKTASSSKTKRQTGAAAKTKKTQTAKTAKTSSARKASSQAKDSKKDSVSSAEDSSPESADTK